MNSCSLITEIHWGFFGLFSLLSPSFEYNFINVMKSMLLLVVFFACSLYFLSKSQIYETFECSALEGNKKRKSFKENGHFFSRFLISSSFFCLLKYNFEHSKRKPYAWGGYLLQSITTFPYSLKVILMKKPKTDTGKRCIQLINGSDLICIFICEWKKKKSRNYDKKRKCSTFFECLTQNMCNTCACIEYVNKR